MHGWQFAKGYLPRQWFLLLTGHTKIWPTSLIYIIGILKENKKIHEDQKPPSLIDWLIDSLTDPLVPTVWRRLHAQTVWDRSSSYKIDYVIVIKNFINHKGHQNTISGSKFTVILLKGGFFLLVELQQGRVCDCSLRSRLVLLKCYQKVLQNLIHDIPANPLA